MHPPSGAPFVIVLSTDASSTSALDDSACILLDHVPHNDVGGASSGSTKKYNVTVNIPDIDCEHCVLRMINPMTDKTSGRGYPYCIYDPECTDCTEVYGDGGGKCYSNYHSCADISITGSTPSDEFTCDNLDMDDWPYVGPTHRYVQEAAPWSDGWLTEVDVPLSYRTPSGVCAGMELPETNGLDDEDEKDTDGAKKGGNGGAVAAAIIVPLLLIGAAVGGVFFMKTKNMGPWAVPANTDTAPSVEAPATAE